MALPIEWGELEVSDRKWVKGANGLWTSYDRVIQKQIDRAKAKAEREAMKAKVGVEE